MLKFLVASFICRCFFVIVSIFYYKRWMANLEGIIYGIIAFMISYGAYSNLVGSVILFVIITLLMWLWAKIVFNMFEQTDNK